jgi:hypothetical protein
MSSLGPLSFALSERTDSAPITDGFSDVLNCLVRGDTYRARPPVGPPEDLPALNNDELDALRAESNLADFSDSEQYNYSSLSLFEGDARSKEVPYPSNSLLSDLNICGIDGSNQRVARTSFYFILTRASIVEFKYSSKNAKPYFYDRCEEASAVTLVDGNINIEAVLNNAGPSGQDAVAQVTRSVFLPQTPETFSYDLDGNLIADGRWAYAWDGENRLVSMQTLPAAVASGAPNQKLTFAYDSQGRRVQKTVSNWANGVFVLASDFRYVYDGWNLAR